jgi:hypothetical protein
LQPAVFDNASVPGFRGGGIFCGSADSYVRLYSAFFLKHTVFLTNPDSFLPPLPSTIKRSPIN